MKNVFKVFTISVSLALFARQKPVRDICHTHVTTNSRSTIKKLPVPVCLLVWALACGTPYTTTSGTFTAVTDNFAVELPIGWRKYDAALDHQPLARALVERIDERREFKRDLVRITKDGFSLQQIAVGKIIAGEDLPHTKKKILASMLPQEASEVMVDNFRSNNKVARHAILANEPATVGGKAGFKLLYSYQTQEGLNINVAYYGLLHDGALYYLMFEAPTQYYFLRDLPDFERIKQSFKILSGTS